RLGARIRSSSDSRNHHADDLELFGVVPVRLTHGLGVADPLDWARPTRLAETLRRAQRRASRRILFHFDIARRSLEWLGRSFHHGFLALGAVGRRCPVVRWRSDCGETGSRDDGLWMEWMCRLLLPPEF